jgi:OOP family OmpA-OmpF porin
MCRCLFILFLLTGPFVKGQEVTNVQPPALVLHFVYNDFAPVTSAQGPSFHESKAGLAASYLRGLDRRLDLSVTLAGAILRFPFRKGLPDDTRQLLLVEGDVSLRWKLLPYYHWLSPYLRAGLGISHYHDRVGGFAPAGGGVQVNLTPYTFFIVEAQYRAPLTSDQTGHAFYSLGLGGIIRKKKRVLVKKAAPMPAMAATLPMPPEKNVLLDSDGDGVIDSLDACPSTPGQAAYQGCPPPLKSVAGVTDTIVQKIRAAAGRVYFETGAYELLPASYPALNEVAAMLEDYPSLKIGIEGHTDNVGADRDNQLLSQRRSEAVMAYLLGKIVAGAHRLSARGYGPARPIATNATAAGRALNRRVEFRVVQD